MTVFLILAAVLTLAVVVRLLWPLWRGSSGSTLTVDQLNSTVYRDQLQELERDLARGQLTDAAYAEARDELQRRLLEDVGSGSAQPVRPAARSGRWTALVLALLVPLGAAGVYSRVGNPAAMTAPVAGNAPSDDVLRAVENLAEALRQQPDNHEGWVLLGRAYTKMGRFADAVVAYERAAPLVQKNADLLVEQADVLAAASGDQLEGRPMALVRQAIALEPRHPMGLMLMGMSAYRRGDFAGAVAQWDTLLTVLPAGSPDAAQVQSNIDQARRDGQLPAPAAGAASTPAMASASAPAAATTATVSGEVAVAPALAADLKPDDVLFVIARPDDGSRVPLAVLRKRVADLPLRFTLDDSLAMMPERTVSKAKSVVLVARISRSGEPIPQAGDLTSAPSAPVAPGAKGVRLVIDKKL